MIKVQECSPLDSAKKIDGELVLDHEQREKSRFRAKSSLGEEVRVFLEHGPVLSIGTILHGMCGTNLIIVGAKESVLTASSEDRMLFSKACYHLGNRHVKLQIGDSWLRISPDHVLEDMLRNLGMKIDFEKATFVPEVGAYYNLPKGSAYAHEH